MPLAGMEETNMEEWFSALRASFDLAGMDALHLVGQILGYVAMLLMIFSYQFRTRLGVLLSQMLSSALWVAHFFLLGSPTGAILNLIVIPRNICYSLLDKPFFHRLERYFPYLFILLFTAGGLLTYRTWVDLLPICGMAFSSFALRIRNGGVLRLLSVGTSVMWLIYDSYAGSPAGVLCELVTLLSIVVALLRFTHHAPVNVTAPEEIGEKEGGRDHG